MTSIQRMCELTLDAGASTRFIESPFGVWLLERETDISTLRVYYQFPPHPIHVPQAIEIYDDARESMWMGARHHMERPT